MTDAPDTLIVDAPSFLHDDVRLKATGELKRPRSNVSTRRWSKVDFPRRMTPFPRPSSSRPDLRSIQWPRRQYSIVPTTAQPMPEGQGG